MTSSLLRGCLCLLAIVGQLKVWHHSFLIYIRTLTLRYLKGWFAVDFTSAFPFYELVSVWFRKDQSSLRLLKPVLRMARFLKLMRLVRQIPGDMCVELSGVLIALSV